MFNCWFCNQQLSVASLSSFQLRVLQIPTSVASFFFLKETIYTLSLFKFQFFVFVLKLCIFSQFHGKSLGSSSSIIFTLLLQKYQQQPIIVKTGMTNAPKHIAAQIKRSFPSCLIP